MEHVSKKLTLIQKSQIPPTQLSYFIAVFVKVLFDIIKVYQVFLKIYVQK